MDETQTIPFKEALQKLITLQTKDKEVDSLKAKIEAYPKQAEEKHAKLDEAKHELEAVKELGNRLLLERKSLEGEVIKKDEEMRKHGGELQSVKSNEAYKGVLNMIENCKKEKSQIEDKILENMEKTDELKRNESKIKQAAEAKKKSVEQEIVVLDGEKKAEEESLIRLAGERDQLIHGIPEETLARYDKVRARRGVALAAVEGGSCGGCHNNLTQSILNEMKKSHDFVSCETCQRILYAPEKVENPA